MNVQIFIKPSSKGLIVRDPKDRSILSEKGEWKPTIGKEGNYWRRRLNCGDVKEISPPKQQTQISQNRLIKDKKEE